MEKLLSRTSRWCGREQTVKMGRKPRKNNGKAQLLALRRTFFHYQFKPTPSSIQSDDSQSNACMAFDKALQIPSASLESKPYDASRASTSLYGHIAGFTRHPCSVIHFCISDGDCGYCITSRMGVRALLSDTVNSRHLMPPKFQPGLQTGNQVPMFQACPSPDNPSTLPPFRSRRPT